MPCSQCLNQFYSVSDKSVLFRRIVDLNRPIIKSLKFKLLIIFVNRDIFDIPSQDRHKIDSDIFFPHNSKVDLLDSFANLQQGNVFHCFDPPVSAVLPSVLSTYPIFSTTNPLIYLISLLHKRYSQTLSLQHKYVSAVRALF